MAFPTYSDSVDVAQLQTAVLELVRSRVKSGTVSGTIPIGQQYVDVTVTFGTPFGATPAVSGAVRTITGVLYGAVVQSVTPSGFVVRLMRPTGASSAVAAGLSYEWHATDLGNS